MKLHWGIRWIGGFLLLVAVLITLRMRSGSGSFRAANDAERPTLRVGFLPVT